MTKPVDKELLIAANNGHTGKVRELLKEGAKIEARSETGDTPLIRAAMQGHIRPIRVLREKGADIEARDSKQEWTPLIWAAVEGRQAAETIRELLTERKGVKADVNAEDKNGMSAFDHWQDRNKNHPDFREISDLLLPKNEDN